MSRGSSFSRLASLFVFFFKSIVRIQSDFYLIFHFLVILSGLSAATENALKKLLTQSNDPTDRSNRDGYTGNAVALIAGGAREAMAFLPNTYKCAICEYI